MTNEEKTEQEKLDEMHIAAAEANRNAEYIDLNETNRKLHEQLEQAKTQKRKMGGD
jgi:hypothetical protein